MKNKIKDSIIVGFALFSMFFGAGNLIFPPSLGNKLGDQYLLGIIGFILTGVGLPLLAIFACSKGNGTFKSITSKIGTKFSIIFTAILFFAIGPLLQYQEQLQLLLNLQYFHFSKNGLQL